MEQDETRTGDFTVTRRREWSEGFIKDVLGGLAVVIIVVVIFVGLYWMVVQFKRADMKKKQTNIEECGTFENESMRTLCLEDAG